MDQATEPQFRHPGALALGEVVPAALVVALAGLALFLLVSTLEAGGEPLGGGAATTPAPVSQDLSVAAQPAGVHLFIVAVGQERSAEVSASLVRESEIRQMLGEPTRDAEVIAATDEIHAQAIAESILDQSKLPGIAPMAVVVVR